MVNEAKNSPAVIMWSIGNEIPNWVRPAALPVAQRLIDDIHAIDTTRPVVAGSDQYRSTPATGSVAEQMLLKLDGLGLNYNPALVVDAAARDVPHEVLLRVRVLVRGVHARGYYLDPDLVNTVQNQTPGQRNASSYDNNLASWTMSDEYGLKKDRDRPYFAGQFIWSGFDYIGEPTPYSVFPVKTSFFGAIDTAGFPKDAYYVFQSQWTGAPMVHLVPMNWTDHKPGDNVQVWAYSNADSVELFLNGVSLGTRSFDGKTSTDGAFYRETSQCSRDDKNYTTGACPGSYQSPNGSSGELHLTWNVPFQPGKLVAVARLNSLVVARDEIHTAGAPYTMKLTPDTLAITADGKSLSYLTVDVLDSHGVEVPNAGNLITFSVTGAGIFAGADNGREEDAQGYQQPSHTAFNGKALAIVESTNSPGSITVIATAEGLLPATTTIFSVAAPSRALNVTPRTFTSNVAIVGVLPVDLRTRLGAPIALPHTVVAVRTDGSTQNLAVKWAAIPRTATTRTGIYTINGTVPGNFRSPAFHTQAILTVYDVGGIQSFSTVVPVGTPADLPATIKLVWDDGVSQYLPVAWDPVDPSRYATPGTFVVNGSVAGTSTKAAASVRVTDDVLPNQNVALGTNPLVPSAGASYSGRASFVDPPTIPSALIDGNTSSGGWSNRFVKSATNTLPSVSNAHASDWVSISWPNPQRLGNTSVFFTQNTNSQLPASIVVSTWNGLTWVPASNVQIELAAASNTASTITFDAVSTTGLRLDMTSASPNDPTTGNLTIAELQVFADQVTYNTTASLTDLRVDGQTVPGFHPGTHSYREGRAGTDGAVNQRDRGRQRPAAHRSPDLAARKRNGHRDFRGRPDQQHVWDQATTVSRSGPGGPPLSGPNPRRAGTQPHLR